MKGKSAAWGWVFGIIIALIIVTVLVLRYQPDFAGNMLSTFSTKSGGFLNDFMMSKKIM